MKCDDLLTALAGMLGLLLWAGWATPALPAQGGKPKDFKDVAPQDLGVRPVPAQKDAKTGFVVGGKNPTALIKGLKEINGRAVADLEKDMRPGAQSEVGSAKGFLGPDEKLLDVLAADNDYVTGELGLTHQELARHLHVLGALAFKENGKEIVYHGLRLKVSGVAYRGYQLSPFRDGTKTNRDATVRNVETGKELAFSLLVPHLMERYGFYEGKGTPYRVEPRRVVEVFDFLKKAKQ